MRAIYTRNGYDNIKQNGFSHLRMLTWWSRRACRIRGMVSGSKGFIRSRSTISAPQGWPLKGMTFICWFDEGASTHQAAATEVAVCPLRKRKITGDVSSTWLVYIDHMPGTVKLGRAFSPDFMSHNVGGGASRKESRGSSSSHYCL